MTALDSGGATATAVGRRARPQAHPVGVVVAGRRADLGRRLGLDRHAVADRGGRVEEPRHRAPVLRQPRLRPLVRRRRPQPHVHHARRRREPRRLLQGGAGRSGAAAQRRRLDAQRLGRRCPAARSCSRRTPGTWPARRCGPSRSPPTASGPRSTPPSTRAPAPTASPSPSSTRRPAPTPSARRRPVSASARCPAWPSPSTRSRDRSIRRTTSSASPTPARRVSSSTWPPPGRCPPLRNATHHVDVDGLGGHVKVAIDGAPVLDQAVTVPNQALLAFTAGTGGLTDRHSITNVVDPAAGAEPGGGARPRSTSAPWPWASRRRSRSPSPTSAPRRSPSRR